MVISFAVSLGITLPYVLLRGLRVAFCCVSFSVCTPFKYQLGLFVKSKGCQRLHWKAARKATSDHLIYRTFHNLLMCSIQRGSVDSKRLPLVSSLEGHWNLQHFLPRSTACSAGRVGPIPALLIGRMTVEEYIFLADSTVHRPHVVGLLDCIPRRTGSCSSPLPPEETCVRKLARRWGFQLASANCRVH